MPTMSKLSKEREFRIPANKPKKSISSIKMLLCGYQLPHINLKIGRGGKNEKLSLHYIKLAQFDYRVMALRIANVNMI